MPSVSPQPPTAPSPKNTAGMQHRPGALKRNSSSTAYPLSKQSVASSGSITGAEQQPLKHTGRQQRHAKIVLPRNHSSGRNLAKLARQAVKEQQYADDGHRHARQRSHEGDTEIRLPGSLDESNTRPPPMRRNMTAYQLPKSSSHVKLKKNLSHGHLSRLPSGKNLMALTSSTQRAPPSPGLKGKSKRTKSVEIVSAERNLHEREEQILREQQEKKEGKRKVGFAVGSAGDTTEGEDVPDMEGSGLQEDEWTEESADASPYSTRQNTANNSRRASITERHPVSKDEQLPVRSKPQVSIQEPAPQLQDDVTEEETESGSEVTETDDEPPPPQSNPVSKKENVVESTESQRQVIQPKPPQRSPLHAAKDYPNPATRRTLSRNASLPAPALVSNVSALDDRGSPSASMVSSRSNLEGSADAEDELVSRFIPSGSHPSTGSGANTTLNTPRTSGWHTPTEESSLSRARGGPLHSGMTSPGSTVSGTSSANTPAHGRSRIELKMLGEKALADREAAAERAPTYPHHIYDRRNETLKSYLNMATAAADRRSGIGPNSGLSLGPEIFQGRFKAVNTELKVVQRYRNPITECVTRLKQRKGSRLSQRNTATKQHTAALKASKSAVALASSQRASAEVQAAETSARRAEMAQSDGPGQSGGALPNVKSAVNIGTAPGVVKAPADIRRSGMRRGVSFAGAPTTRGEDDAGESETGPDAVARQLWVDLT